MAVAVSRWVCVVVAASLLSCAGLGGEEPPPPPPFQALTVEEARRAVPEVPGARSLGFEPVGVAVGAGLCLSGGVEAGEEAVRGALRSAGWAVEGTEQLLATRDGLLVQGSVAEGAVEGCAVGFLFSVRRLAREEVSP